MMKKYPELLAPAGTFECLEAAYYFGADAAYVAGKAFGLRAFAVNFDNENMEKAVKLARSLNKKLYVTVNSVIHNHQFEELIEYLKFLSEVGVDAVIVSDPGVVYVIKQNNIDLEIHLSTQNNTFNFNSAKFWYEQGVKRIVLSRELTLAEIEEISNKTPEDLEIETFVHGAMCVAHSGRCLLSYALTGRSGNKGECAQPCRWEYHLHEKGYEGEFFPISEDEYGTYILNSKDLMMIEHVDLLCKAGISSFKIEGRMKSPYYVASVVSAYRKAMDEYFAQGEKYKFNQKYKTELVKSATRQFCTGFYFGKPEQDLEKYLSPDRKYSFVGIVKQDAENGIVKVEQRNKFCVGDTLEILSPNITDAAFTVTDIVNESGENQESAPHPQQIVYLSCPYELKIGDIIRKAI